MDKVKNEGKQTTPDLDRIMEDGRQVFAGSAEPPADETGPVVVGGPGQEIEAPPEPPPVAAPQPAVAPQEPVGKGHDAPRGDYRFRDLGEADKSYRLLQGEKTKADLRIKALENELSKRREAEATQEAARAAEAEDQQFTDFATERNKQALEEINALDVDDSAYTAKAAACWTRANLAIRHWAPAADKTVDAPSPDAARPAAAGRPTEGDGSATPDGAAITTRGFIEGVLESTPELGIPKDDPVFWAFAEQSPSFAADGTPIPMKDQIWYAVERTLGYRRDIIEKHSPTRHEKPPPVMEATGLPPATPPAPAPAAPMGRSGAFRPPAGGDTPARPVSLAETLDTVMEMRRL